MIVPTTCDVVRALPQDAGVITGGGIVEQHVSAKRKLGIEDGRQFFVVDPDEPRGRLGGGCRFGRDGFSPTKYPGDRQHIVQPAGHNLGGISRPVTPPVRTALSGLVMQAIPMMPACASRLRIHRHQEHAGQRLVGSKVHLPADLQHTLVPRN